MLTPLLLLIGGTLAAYGAALVFWGPEAIRPATLAVVVTLPPAVGTFLAVARVCRKWPTAGPAVVMAGTFFRMVVAVGFVAVLQDRAAEYGTTPTALAEWTTGFYLITLAAETALLCVWLSKPTRANDEPPAG